MNNKEELKSLVNLLETKTSIPISLVNTHSDFITQFPVPIDLGDKNHGIGLLWFAAYNTIFNFDKSDNKLYYSTDNGSKWKLIEIPVGAYEVNQLDLTIKRLMKANGDWDSQNNSFYISIDIDRPTSKSILSITNKQYQVDFTKTGTIRFRLGFESKVIKVGDNYSDNIVQITNLSTINIECDICEGSYFNGKLGSILYSFPSYTVPVGYKIIERIYQPIYLPVKIRKISRIRIRIIDEEGSLINFNNEEIALFLHIKQF